MYYCFGVRFMVSVRVNVRDNCFMGSFLVLLCVLMTARTV